MNAAGGPELEQVARAIQRHRVTRDDVAGRAGGEHDDLVGKRNRFLEIVGDEDHGLSIWTIAALNGPRDDLLVASSTARSGPRTTVG
jgi:hypothetical protein